MKLGDGRPVFFGKNVAFCRLRIQKIKKKVGARIFSSSRHTFYFWIK